MNFRGRCWSDEATSRVLLYGHFKLIRSVNLKEIWYGTSKGFIVEVWKYI